MEKQSDKEKDKKQKIDKTTISDLMKDVQKYFTSPEKFIELVNFLNNFPHYSMKNRLLINSQRPAPAVAVASFKKFEDLGYAVKRGEHGLKIFVPIQTTQFWRKDKFISVKYATKIEKDETLSIISFRETANHFVFEGQNPKPKEPSHLFVINFLSKNNIGTGATQESTLAEMSTGTNKLIENKQEKSSLTNLGLIQAAISRHTQIASPKVTLKLQEAMEQVGKLAIPTMAIPNTMANIVIHDKQTMINNQQNLTSVQKLQKAKVEWNKRQEKINVPRIAGNWQGKEVSIKSKWGDHSFTKSELTQLFADKTITFDTAQGKVSGKLAE
ncbi:ArdC-like ssDNA-binding domain-containing protein [Lactobacillus sp. ESL0230]|uniref:ArdC-like ssDNA-binding domain-containing protein n=1 Tax=Lactobacillus sp. ESL0230 TaxID=2069353 RepID=UPI000EFD0BD0|nr:ArdC-like ssDNA-binding domain-containing protein [Lactobacillus sp. ESL0230]RMC46126.1 hypothetical protein F5ESL0230_02400 [Lactobacillus sp. ESL0230]